MINVIGTFWIGSRLSDLHRLCVSSWLEQGYQVDFFCYRPVENVPEGVAVRDANEIIDRAVLIDGAPELREDERANSKADIFRLAMLRSGGRIWCDADYLMLRPLPAFENILIGREQNGFLCNAVLWLKPEHEMLSAVVEAYRTRSIPPWTHAKTRLRRLRQRMLDQPLSLKDYPLHQWGRHALSYFIERSNLIREVQDFRAFYYPVVYDECLYRRETPFEHILADPRVYGLHLFKKRTDHFDAYERGSFHDWANSRFGAQLN